MLYIPEILRHGKSRLRHSHSCTGRLVHLPEDKCRILDNTGLRHLVIEVVSLTGTLSHTGKNGISAMLCCDISNQFLNQDRLSYTGTPKEADLSTLRIWGNQVNDLDSGFQDLLHRALLGKGWRFSVNFPSFLCRNRVFSVNGLSQYIKESSESFLSYRNGNSSSRGLHFHISFQALTGG